MSNDLKAKAREAAKKAYWSHSGPLGTELNDALDAYERALSAPQGATRQVRIAVGQAADGSIWCEGGADQTPKDEEDLWKYMSDSGYPIPLAIVTADIPIRDVPEIAGDVEGV